MDVLNFAGLVWNKFIVITGTIFAVTGIIAIIVSLIEKAAYRRKSRARTAAAPETAKTRRAAVITGASSGLGKKYALMIAADMQSFDVDEIWLIARRRERLEETASAVEELGAHAEVIPMDVTSEEDLGRLSERFREAAAGGDDQAFRISFLANCAGFGSYGTSEEIGHDEEIRMFAVNDDAAIAVTDICVPYMGAGARIAEICSVASFQPIPFFNAYAASKALLYTYSRGLRVELMKKGISVTAVCPYWIHDTEFIEKAAGSRKKPFLSVSSDKAARRSLRSVRRRSAVATPGLVCTAERYFSCVIPDELLAFIMPKFL